MKALKMFGLNVIAFYVVFNAVLVAEMLPLHLFANYTGFSSKLVYGIFLAVAIAPLVEEGSKLIWMKIRGTSSAAKYALAFGIVESIYYCFMFWTVMGWFVVPSRLLSIGMHVYTVRLMSRKGYWAAVIFHSVYNAIAFAVALKMGWVI